MMSDRDPFEILRQNDPARHGPPPDPRSDEGRALLNRITSMAPEGKHRRRIHRYAIAIAVALLLIAAAWTWYGHVTVIQGVTCYAANNLNADRAGAMTNPPSTNACTDAWTSGLLSNPEYPEGTIPPLTGCINDDGALFVFPTEDPGVCSRLGLANQPTPSTTAPSKPTPADLQDELVEYFSDGCVPYGEAATHIEEVLAVEGFDGWTITTQTPSEDRPCGSFSIEPQTKTVYLVPIPEPPDG